MNSDVENLLPGLNTRIKEIIQKYSNGNVALFSTTLPSITQQRLNRIFNLDTRTKKYPSVPDDILMNIADVYSNVNLDWLLTGRGEMEKQSSEIVSEDNITLDINMDAKEVVIKALAEKIQRLESEIAELRRKYEASEERPGA